MTTEVSNFNYKQLDATTAEFLLTKERNIGKIVGKAYTDLGRELKEAQERLRRQGSVDGVFMSWYQSIGFKKDAVSRLINRYELFAICEEPQRELIEDLPVSLTYEISAPSADKTEPKRQAKAAVLAGEVKTSKEYHELISKLREAEERADKAELRYDEIRETLEDVYEQPKQVEYVYVQNESNDPLSITSDIRINGNVQRLSESVGKLVADFGYFAYYDRQISELSEKSVDELKTAFTALEQFMAPIRRALNNGTTIIDMEAN